MIRIITRDGKLVACKPEFMNMSGLIRDALAMDPEQLEVAIPNIEATQLNLIIDYCEHFDYNKTETTLKPPLQAPGYNDKG